MVQHFDTQNVLHNNLIQIYFLPLKDLLRGQELYFRSCQHVFVIHVIALRTSLASNECILRHLCCMSCRHLQPICKQEDTLLFVLTDRRQVFLLGMLLAKLRQLLDQHARSCKEGGLVPGVFSTSPHSSCGTRFFQWCSWRRLFLLAKSLCSHAAVRGALWVFGVLASWGAGMKSRLRSEKYILKYKDVQYGKITG